MTLTIRKAAAHEFEELGDLTARAYQELDGMPGPKDQPGYYAMLRDVKTRAAQPLTEIWVAAAPQKGLLGGVTLIGDLRYYGAGARVSEIRDSSGIRLLAIRPHARGQGIGKALTLACIARARELGQGQVILHTTKAMAVAWNMYEKMGFTRSRDLDFDQGGLAVYGFRLPLHPPGPTLPPQGEDL